MKILREELSRKVAEKLGIIIDDCDDIFLCYLDTIREVLLDGDDIKIMDFGTFSTKKTNRRKSRNPKTGEEIVVEGKVLPEFKFAKRYKDKFAEECNFVENSKGE